MTDNTNFFSDDNSQLKELKNNNNLSDQEIYPFLSSSLSLYFLVEKILKAHNKEIKADIEPELLPYMEEIDLIVACYQEEISIFDYNSLKKMSESLLYGYYCQSNYSTVCFYNAILNLCDICQEMSNIIDRGDSESLNFDNAYRETMEQCFYDLNYCILANFKLLSYENNEILSCVRYLQVVENINIQELADKMAAIYSEHRPDLEFLNKYPEIFEKLATYVPMSLLLDLISVSDCVESEEWKELLPNSNGTVKKEIDADFLEELYARSEQKMAERLGDSNE